MFRCIIKAHALEFNATFSRTVELPFAPFPGLKLGSLITDDSDFEDAVIDEVGWDVQYQHFECVLKQNIDWIDIGDGMHPDWIDEDRERSVNELYEEGLFHPESQG